MRAAALKAFMSETGRLEGAGLRHMYIDFHKDPDGTLNPLVTTGTGNLIDPVGVALNLPWQRPDGSFASQAEIVSDWNAIKARTDLAHLGGNSQAQRDVTTLRLSPEAVNDLVANRIAINEGQIRNLAPQYDNWPSAAQVGINEMVWAMGAGNLATFHHFLNAVNALSPDFKEAAIQSHISNASDDRNKDTAQLFNEAAQILSQNLDLETIFFPGPVLASAASAIGVSGGFLAWLSGLLGIGLVYVGYNKLTKGK